MKYISDVETAGFILEVYECACGYHMGIDHTFIEHADIRFRVLCPACGSMNWIEIDYDFPEYEL